VLLLLVKGYLWWTSQRMSFGYYSCSAFGDGFLSVMVGGRTVGGFYADPNPFPEEPDVAEGFWRDPLSPSGRDASPLGGFDFERNTTGSGFVSLQVPIWLLGFLLSAVLLACGSAGRRHFPVEE